MFDRLLYRFLATFIISVFAMCITRIPELGYFAADVNIFVTSVFIAFLATFLDAARDV